MTDKEKKSCHHIIHMNAVAASGVAAGLAQLPSADLPALMAIEIEMVIALGKVFDISVTESGAKGLITSLAGATIGRTISQWLVGWIPVYGNAINASTAAGVVEALGWAAADHFDNEKNG